MSHRCRNEIHVSTTVYQGANYAETMGGFVMREALRTTETSTGLLTEAATAPFVAPIAS